MEAIEKQALNITTAVYAKLDTILSQRMEQIKDMGSELMSKLTVEHKASKDERDAFGKPFVNAV